MGLTPTEIYAINGVMAQAMIFIVAGADIITEDAKASIQIYYLLTAIQSAILLTLLLGRLVL